MFAPPFIRPVATVKDITVVLVLSPHSYIGLKHSYQYAKAFAVKNTISIDPNAIAVYIKTDFIYLPLIIKLITIAPIAYEQKDSITQRRLGSVFISYCIRW